MFSSALSGVSNFLGGMGKANFVGNEIKEIAHGHFKEAAVNAVEHFALKAETWKGAAKTLTHVAEKAEHLAEHVEHMSGRLAKVVGRTAETLAEDASAVSKLSTAVKPVAEALETAGRAMPIVSAVITGVTDAAEVYHDIKAGEYKKAAVAAVAGVVETGLSTTGGAGFLAGQAIRQGIVEAADATMHVRANDAMVVAGAKTLYGLGKEGVEAGTELAREGVNAGSKFVASLNSGDKPGGQTVVAAAETPAAAAPVAAAPSRPVSRGPGMGA
jgi:hypothetical protein